MLGRVESARSRFVAQINERKASLVVEIAPSLPPPRLDRCIREIAERSTLFAVANRTIRALFCETEPPILDTRSFSYSLAKFLTRATCKKRLLGSLLGFCSSETLKEMIQDPSGKRNNVPNERGAIGI